MPTTPADQPGATSQAGLDPAAELLGRLPAEAAAVRAVAFVAVRRRQLPGAGELAAATGLPAEQVRQALRLLVATGTATVDHDDRVTGVGGLSLAPTRHRLRLDGVDLHTWCAFDLIGIPVTLGADAAAVTPCGHCGQPIQLLVQHGRPVAKPAVTGWLPSAACRNVLAEFCPQANLFCDQAHLAAWRTQAGDPPGEALDLAELAERGRQARADLQAGRCC